jgi:hypothetical protein
MWVVLINGTALSAEEITVTENATHTCIYFTFPPGINDVQITTGFRPSTISMSLSETSIRLGSSVTISGSINPVRPNVRVTVYNRTKGATTWDTLANVTTNRNSVYNCTWKPGRGGTYEVKANWPGDDVTFGNESNVLTLTVLKESSVISIALSSAKITLGESVTVSGIIIAADNIMRGDVNVMILNVLSGGLEWLATVQTYPNSSYAYILTPNAAGTYKIKANWPGDDVTFGNESNVLTLTVEKAPAGISIEIIIVIVVAIVATAAVVVYYFVGNRRRKNHA